MWGGHFWLQLVFSGLEQSRRAIQETVQERDTWRLKRAVGVPEAANGRGAFYVD